MMCSQQRAPQSLSRYLLHRVCHGTYNNYTKFIRVLITQSLSGNIKSTEEVTKFIKEAVRVTFGLQSSDYFDRLTVTRI